MKKILICLGLCFILIGNSAKASTYYYSDNDVYSEKMLQKYDYYRSLNDIETADIYMYCYSQMKLYLKGDFEYKYDYNEDGDGVVMNGYLKDYFGNKYYNRDMKITIIPNDNKNQGGKVKFVCTFERANDSNWKYAYVSYMDIPSENN